MRPSAPSNRLPLDALFQRMLDPSFTASHRRRLSFRETSPHVNPVMLAVASNDSFYVGAWRDHARECGACAQLFEYFGLDL